MFNVTPLERTTFRGALALAFSDLVTGKAVTDYLRVHAYRFDPGNVQPTRKVQVAEKSPRSGIFGFRTLPGLERYQIGEDIAVGSVSYIVHIVDDKQRYLPQVHQVDLPFADPAVQQMTLHPAPTYTASSGYGVIRGSLLQTTSAPNLIGVGPARWAGITVTMPGNNPGDPSITYRGMADVAGQFILCVAHPIIPNNILLTQAQWSIDVSVQYQPASYADELARLRTFVPALADDILPFQTSLDAQATADVATSVTVIDEDEQRYTAVSVTSNPVPATLSFGNTLLIQTQISGMSTSLSEMLVIPT